jgi:hypothetical protein
MPVSARATTLAQRIEIWERAQQGERDTQIASALQLSPVTVRKWRRRARDQGRPGLVSHIGRPASGALGHSTPALRARVRELRVAHPGWGPITLRLELAQDRRCADQPLPSRSRLAAFLKATALSRQYGKRTELPQPEATIQAPHDEWELDAQGVQQVNGLGKVTLINVGDPYSHLRTASLACLGKTKADTADYQLALRRAFLRYGLPHALSLDHDSVFYDVMTRSPYPSRLHLWLLALGVAVRFIRIWRPTDHGFIERSHQVIWQQAHPGQPCADLHTWQNTLEQRLDFLNQTYPSRSLGGRAPLEAYPSAQHSGRDYWPENEADMLDLQHVYDYLAQQRWFRRVSSVGQFTLGGQPYSLGKAWGSQTVEISFDPATQELRFLAEDGQRRQRRPVKGLTKTDLMGELDLAQFPNYQYAFPWSAAACRNNLLHSDLAAIAA